MSTACYPPAAPAHRADRYRKIIALINQVYARRRKHNRPVWHLPRRAAAMSDAYLAALAWEREQDYLREQRAHFAQA